MSFERTTHVYLLKISITHDINKNPLLYLLIIFTQNQHPNIVFKEEHTYCFSNFSVLILCNSSANHWFDLIILLIAPPEVLAPEHVLSKNV